MRQASGLAGSPNFACIRQSPFSSRNTHPPSGLWARRCQVLPNHPPIFTKMGCPCGTPLVSFQPCFSIRSFSASVMKIPCCLQQPPQLWQLQFCRVGSSSFRDTVMAIRRMGRAVPLHHTRFAAGWLRSGGFPAGRESGFFLRSFGTVSCGPDQGLPGGTTRRPPISLLTQAARQICEIP